MRRAAILAAALLLATATTVQAGTVPKVSGSFQYEYMGGTSRVMLDASSTTPATGRWSFTRVGVASFSGDVTCVVVDGQDAWVVGTFASPDSGGYFMFRVHDGMLPAGAGDSALSFGPGPGTGPDCTFPLQWNLTAKWMVPVTSGNIRID